MIKQIFATHCENCGEEIKTAILDMTGGNEIIVDFIEGMEFECECGSTTHLEVEKHTY